MVVVLRIEAEATRDRQKSRRGDAFGVARAGTVLGQDVAGDLLAEELVVRLVGVEGIDDVVAVAPRHGHRIIRGLARRVGVADDVEPMAAPALAVGRGTEQAVHHLGEGIRRRIGDEGIRLGRCRREPGEVERGAAEQRAAVGGGRGFPVVGFETRQDEIIDARPDPRGVRDHRRRGFPDRLERPMRSLRTGRVHAQQRPDQENHADVPVPHLVGFAGTCHAVRQAGSVRLDRMRSRPATSEIRGTGSRRDLRPRPANQCA